MGRKSITTSSKQAAKQAAKQATRTTYRWLVCGLAFGMIGLQTTEVHAGPLLDWLFRRNRAATNAYYPVTTTTANYAPASGASDGACCGAAQCEQTVLRYVPQVAYRTVWQPVPVTTYKRTVSYNPTTGLPLRCTQPCTTYTYQARRVPYTTYRPTYATVPVTMAGNCGTSYTPNTYAPTTYAAPVAAAAYSVPQSGCGCNAGAPAMGFSDAGGQSPYYTVPETPGATEWEPAPNTAQDGPSTWQPDPAFNGGQADPANQRPRLELERPDYEGASLHSRTPSVKQQTGYARDRFYREPSNHASFDREPSEWTTVPAEPRATSRWDSSEYARQRGIASEPSTTSAFENRASVQPLPNLDAPRNGSRIPMDQVAPRLLNEPRDNTASLIRTIPTRWASNRIVWPVSYERPSHEPDSRPTLRSSTQATGREWSREFGRAPQRRLNAGRFPRIEPSTESSSASGSATRRPVPNGVREDGWRSRNRATRGA